MKVTITNALRESRKRERKDTSATHTKIPGADPLEAPQMGAADRETQRRRNLDSARTLECTPRLLLRQEQQGPQERRPRASALRNLESQDLTCECGHLRIEHKWRGEIRAQCYVPRCGCLIFCQKKGSHHATHESAKPQRSAHSRTDTRP
jgi:hypothetical protein